MIVDTLLENCKIVRREDILEANIAVEGGQIHNIVKAGAPDADERIDLKGMLVIPGCIDPHVHFRDPGFPEKEDFGSGSLSAAFGGVTTVLDMPNNKPQTISETTLNGKKDIARRKSCVDYGFHFMITRSNLNMLGRIDAPGYKAFLGSETIGFEDLEKAFGKLDNAVVCVHAEDPELINDSKFDKTRPESALEARPTKAEISAVEKILAMDFGTNRVHFCHITTPDAVGLIKGSGNASCEVTPNHLFFDSGHYKTLGNLIKCYPPVREKADVEGLWGSLSDVDCFGTDHAPHTIEQKKAGSSGMPGVETMLPLMMNAVNEGRLDWKELARLCSGAAEIFGIGEKGRIEEGFDADLAVLDRKKGWVIRAENLHSKCGWTPYEGWKVKGGVEKVFLRGSLIVDEGEFVGRPGCGEEI